MTIKYWKRGKTSIVLAGLLLGPFVLFLFLGRWKWALIYFILWPLALLGAWLAAAQGWIDPWSMGVAENGLYLQLAAIGMSAVGVAHGLRVGAQSLKPQPSYSRWYAVIGATAALLLLAVGIRTFVVQPFSVPGESMSPSLQRGDMFFAANPPLFFDRDKLARGDIVAFEHPTRAGEIYVKRVIGLPGDRVQLRDGIVYLNGQALERRNTERVFEAVERRYDVTRGAFEETSTTTLPVVRETLPSGRSFDIIDFVENSSFDNTAETEVLPGKFYVLGDHRDNSTDSRAAFHLGLIPIDNIAGRATMIFWSDVGPERFPRRVE